MINKLLLFIKLLLFKNEMDELIRWRETFSVHQLHLSEFRSIKIVLTNIEATVYNTNNDNLKTKGFYYESYPYNPKILKELLRDTIRGYKQKC
jgi:hypothetical protein